METIIHFGIDVDDKSFHATGITDAGGRYQFNCRPNASSLAAKLNQFKGKGYQIKCCYEAGYLGFSLYRELKALIEHMTEQINRFNDRIMVAAERPEYREPVQALNCYRGIDTLTAMTIITETGDICRFSHPRSFMSFIGLDVREYSSGGVQKQNGITKLGNKRSSRRG